MKYLYLGKPKTKRERKKLKSCYCAVVFQNPACIAIIIQTLKQKHTNNKDKNNKQNPNDKSLMHSSCVQQSHRKLEPGGRASGLVVYAAVFHCGSNPAGPVQICFVWFLNLLVNNQGRALRLRSYNCTCCRTRDRAGRP